MCVFKGKKEKRQDILLRYIKDKPFVTDEELAKKFVVSIQTIRLDRLALGIPQVRERVKFMAETAYTSPRSLDKNEITGELIDVELEKNGISILEITEDMVLEKTKIARGHFLFAQANTLAVAIINADVVLTASSKVKFRRPVYLNEKIVAKAIVKDKNYNKYLVDVNSLVNEELVFTGEFSVSVFTDI